MPSPQRSHEDLAEKILEEVLSFDVEEQNVIFKIIYSEIKNNRDKIIQEAKDKLANLNGSLDEFLSISSNN